MSIGKTDQIVFSIKFYQVQFYIELIHIDTWGPYKTATYDGFKYFLTIVDDFSKGTWTYLLSTKSNIFSVLKSFLLMVERQFNTKVKVIRSDNALELGTSIMTSEFFKSQEILHQTSCVGTPQQNEIVERKHRYLLETCRALMHQSKVPVPFWGDCLLTATSLINKFPSSVLKFKTPYEVLYKQKPSYDLLGTFGCLCFVSTLPIQRGKLEPRAIKGVFLGYPMGKKGNKVMNLQTRKIIFSRNVIFHEDTYPFSKSQTNSVIFHLILDTNRPGSSHSENSSNYEIPSQTPITSPTIPDQNLEHESGTSHISSSRTIEQSPSTLPFNHILTPIRSTLPHSSSQTTSHVPPKRSGRVSTKPAYLKDYVCNEVCFTDLTSSVFIPPVQTSVLPFSSLCLTNQQMLNSISSIIEPTSYAQASLHAGW